MDERTRQIRTRRRRRKTRTQVTAPATFTSRVLPGKRRTAVQGRAPCPGSQIFYLWCSVHKSLYSRHLRTGEVTQTGSPRAGIPVSSLQTQILRGCRMGVPYKLHRRPDSHHAQFKGISRANGWKPAPKPGRAASSLVDGLSEPYKSALRGAVECSCQSRS